MKEYEDEMKKYVENYEEIRRKYEGIQDFKDFISLYLKYNLCGFREKVHIFPDGLQMGEWEVHYQLYSPTCTWTTSKGTFSNPYR